MLFNPKLNRGSRTLDLRNHNPIASNQLSYAHHIGFLTLQSYDKVLT